MIIFYNNLPIFKSIACYTICSALPAVKKSLKDKPLNGNGFIM